MKKLMLTMAMMMGIIITVSAQGQKKEEKREQRNEEIKTMKIGFLNEKLKLTADDATKFLPVYNEYQEKM